jgi:NADPH:quinone reductase-like Zn-dependent oxidoreductase
MKALIFDPTTPGALRLGEAPAPTPTRSQVLVEVHAASLNWAEAAALARLCKPGEVPGWDAAGVVVRAAEDGSGPKVGTRVSTFHWGGAWGELRVAETAEVGVMPDEVDFAAASALPVAGVTALRAVRALGPVLGRRVLVTGASGGVGRYAVQLAGLAGANVVASVGSPTRGAGLDELGADEVVVGMEGVSGLLDGVIDNVGGELIGRAMSQLASGGIIQSVGAASGAPSTIDLLAQRLPNGLRAGGRRVEVFVVGKGLGKDLEYLMSLVAKRRLDASVGWRGKVERASEAIEALLGRRVEGKAVLELR